MHEDDGNFVVETDPLDGEYAIQPRHVDTSRPFWDSFGSAEIEEVARKIVSICQRDGRWRPISDRDVKGIRLLAEGLKLKPGKAGKFHLTHLFVATCFLASPVR